MTIRQRSSSTTNDVSIISANGSVSKTPLQNFEIRRLSFNKSALSFWRIPSLQIVLICIIISTLVQVMAPLFYLLSTNIICKDQSLLSLKFKTWVFNCPSSENDSRVQSRVRKTTNFISYFDDPFMAESPWPTKERNQENKQEMIVSYEPSKAVPSRPKSWTEAEAVAALQAAKRSRAEGNLRRAKQIIEHAYTLAPHHPDILTEYGIFLETAHSNFIDAEGYYLKALMTDPQHSEALIDANADRAEHAVLLEEIRRRAKTLPLVNEIDNRMLKEIHQKRERFLKVPRSDPGLKRAMRESYFQHVYHTVALEGNTMSLIQTRSILETRMAVAGKSIIEHNEILGMDAALRFLNQTLTHVGQLTLEDILAIHKRVLGFVDPLVAGMIRTTQVYVGNFVPTAPGQIIEQMEELMNWLNDEETLRLDAVELAALAHYKLVFIHPFIDGNGRTSRLLMNFILMQAGFPPVIIPVEQRSRYYLTLQEANQGDLRPFIRFIAEQTDRTLESFIASSSVCDIGDCPMEELHHQHSAKLPPVIVGSN